MDVDDAMDVDGGWVEEAPIDDQSIINDGGDAMEVDAEVVREALRTLSASRRGGADEDSEGTGTWAGVWPGTWPGTQSATGTRSRATLSAPFAPRLPTVAAVGPLISASPAPTAHRVSRGGGGSAGTLRELTVVPDTNALVTSGEKSLGMLLDRFASNPAACHQSQALPPRVRVAVPRRVVQELDGLKNASTHRRGAAVRDLKKAEQVSALARGVNRALKRRLDAQLRAIDPSVSNATASLEVQGPGDAAAARLDMRARGGFSGADPSGDEEILFFCQTRRRRNELVAFITADANAAVTAMSRVSTRDVPVCAFHPENLPKNAEELYDALVSFYDAVPGDSSDDDARGGNENAENRKETTSSSDAPPVAAEPTGMETRGVSGKEPLASPPRSPRCYARRVLEALDAALPAAVERMLREELGDLWKAGARDDFDGNAELTADEAFETLRKNHASLLRGGALRMRRGSRADAGREAMRTLATARRARGQHAEARELGSRARAGDIVSIARDVLEGCPRNLPEVVAAAAAAAEAAEALSRLPAEDVAGR